MLRRGRPVKIGVTAIMALGAMAMVGTSAATARAGQQSTVPTGNDISYPQCSHAFPTGQAFGIVAVNEGVANITNSCLAAEMTWARASSGATRQPKVSLYVNTADPGRAAAGDWPANDTDPVTGKHVRDPYGTCSGQDNAACAWQYGWNMADADARTRGVPGPGHYRWWLDVETVNSWKLSAQDNRADLEGMATYFRGIGGAVGIYSTMKQWGPLTGTIRPASPLYRLPDWLAGAKTLAQAERNCRLAPLTGGGTVAVTQWAALPANRDFACPPPPR